MPFVEQSVLLTRPHFYVLTTLNLVPRLLGLPGWDTGGQGVLLRLVPISKVLTITSFLDLRPLLHLIPARSSEDRGTKAASNK
jgi:hypothetical protein